MTSADPRLHAAARTNPNDPTRPTPTINPRASPHDHPPHPEARIAALEAQIARIKTRAERAKLRNDPALRHMRAAVRQIDKAAGACGDRVVRGELREARRRIAACLALGMGLVAVPPRDAGVVPEAKPWTILEVSPKLPQSATSGRSSRSANLHSEPRHAAL